MPERVTKTIRNLDADLYAQALAAASGSKPKKDIGQWINEAIKAKLKKEKRVK